MKKYIFSLLFFLVCMSHLQAQIPVTDVAVNTNMTLNQIENAATLGSQLAELTSQSQVLFTTLKYVQEVSSAIRDVAYAKDLIERQQYILNRCKRLAKDGEKLSANKMRSLSNCLSSLLTTNSSLVSLLNSSLTTRFKMNDSERLQSLMGVKEEQLKIVENLNKVDLILSTSQSTKELIELKFLK